MLSQQEKVKRTQFKQKVNREAATRKCRKLFSLGIGTVVISMALVFNQNSVNGQTDDELRYTWARYIRATVQPRLVALGVDDNLIKQATWFGISEGIFNIANNSGYGQPNGRQSPIGFSNCGDDSSINKNTALPDCFSKYAFKSGNWQVGIAGAQVSDQLGRLPDAYKKIYGNLPPKVLGRSILRWLGEGTTFPNLTIEQIATRDNARWASVILRDPTLNVYVQTLNPAIRGNFGYGKLIVDAVWNEAARQPTSRNFPETGFGVSGLIGQTWFSGNSRWACWNENLVICLATYGFPISNEYPKQGNIPGSNGYYVSEQRFERALLQVNEYPPPTGRIVQGALLGSILKNSPGQPNQPVDDAFAAYYARYGGLPVFGWPLGPASIENGHLVQYFERARLEENPNFNPNNSDPVFEVLRGRLGAEVP